MARNFARRNYSPRAVQWPKELLEIARVPEQMESHEQARIFVGRALSGPASLIKAVKNSITAGIVFGTLSSEEGHSLLSQLN